VYWSYHIRTENDKEEAMKDVIDAHTKHTERLLSIPGVHGVAIGKKVTDGVEIEDICVVVFVDNKLPLSEIEPEHQIPDVLEDTNVKTDVVESSPPVPLSKLSENPPDAPGNLRIVEAAKPVDRARYDPLVGGIEIMSSGGVGTLGTVFYDKKWDRVLGITNDHVVRKHDRTLAKNVYQPSVRSSEKPTHLIGTVLSTDESADAAIISITKANRYEINRAYTFDIADIGTWRGTANVTIGTPVKKRGRTSRLTFGNVKYIRASYGSMTNQIGISPDTSRNQDFSLPGDSGSVILDDQNRIVALLWGATDVGPDIGTAWGTAAEEVEKALYIAFGIDPYKFYSTEFRPWDKPQLQNNKYFTFEQPYSSAPKVPLGINEMDMDYRTNIRLVAHASEISKNGFRAHVDSQADTILYSGGCTWLEIAPGDTDIQWGNFNTMEVRSWDDPQMKASKVITYARPFSSSPNIVVWLYSLDMKKSHNWRLTAYVSEITATSFRIHIDTWGDSVLYSAGATWIAYSGDNPNITGGAFNTGEVRPWNKPQAKQRKNLDFPKPFNVNPKVFVALNTIDVDCEHNLRLSVSVNDLWSTGMTWDISSWGDTILYSAGASYIAIP
jgi:hypothetical protein